MLQSFPQHGWPELDIYCPRKMDTYIVDLYPIIEKTTRVFRVYENKNINIIGMKKLVYSLLALSVMGTSCVFDEEIVSVAEKNQQEIPFSQIPESRATDNVLVVGEEKTGYYTFDWDGDYMEPMVDAVGTDEASLVYAYDGDGGQIKVTDGVPSIVYHQDSNWIDSGFRYAVSDGLQLSKNGMQLQWKDAFSQIKFEIRNQIDNLHLQVRGIRLCRIATEGTFCFPIEGQSATWKAGKKNHTLAYQSDTLDVAPDKSNIIPKEGTLPLIPQTSEVWNTFSIVGWNTGTYVLVDCRIYNISNTDEGYIEGKDYLIWGDDEGGFAEAAVPVAVETSMGNTTILTISLDTSYEWYDISGTNPEKILRPIVFDPSVEDWQNGGTTDIPV